MMVMLHYTTMPEAFPLKWNTYTMSHEKCKVTVAKLAELEMCQTDWTGESDPQTDQYWKFYYN